MKDLQQELLAEAQQGMQTPEGRDDLQADEIKVVAGVIVASVVGGAWAAMDERGKGSLMDTSNPSLDEYKNGPLWNPVRNDTTIRSRSRGWYTNIFGKRAYSKSNIAGIDLEQFGGKYEPQPPSHALETAVRWLKNGRMRSKIQDTIKSFPFGKFIITDKK